MSWGEVVQGGMRAYEVVEKDEHGNEVVGRSERGKAVSYTHLDVYKRQARY